MCKTIHLILMIMFVTGSLSMTVTAQSEQNMLLGYLLKEDFLQEPYNKWFDENYKAYDVEEQILADIDIHQENLTFMVFLGSWCGDTKRELPRFLKIMDHLRFPADKITLIGLDRTKSAPVYTENRWKIQYVPTFIVLKNGIEIGRIIEQPLISLEDDLKNLVGLKYFQKPGSVLIKNIKKADEWPVFGACKEAESMADKSACSDAQLVKYFSSNKARLIKSNSKKGGVKVSFIIDIDGKVKDVKVGNSKVIEHQTKAVRMLNRMNEEPSIWQPARKNGQSVAVRYKILIGFDE